VSNRPGRVADGDLFDRIQIPPLRVHRNRQPDGSGWRLDAIAVAPIAPCVLHIVEEDELVNRADQYSVTAAAIRLSRQNETAAADAVTPCPVGDREQEFLTRLVQQFDVHAAARTGDKVHRNPARVGGTALAVTPRHDFGNPGMRRRNALPQPPDKPVHRLLPEGTP
jgi:hypothetical protein